jgi:hypothetical protein
MARWKLACSHYLMTVKPAKWRYSHTDRLTGDLIEKEYIIPRLLDVGDPKCWTDKFGGVPVSRGGNDPDAMGEINVRQGQGEPNDIEFIGDPTPDMVPLDAEAEEISARFKEHWAYKPDGVEISNSQAIVDRANFVPEPTRIEGMAELTAAIGAMVQQNQAVMQALAEKERRRL